MKTCLKCNKEYGNDSKFCTECGGKLADKQDPVRPSPAISLGDKNVISGEVIGHKEDIRVSGNATIVRNEDQTKEIKKCGVCGRTLLVLDSVCCPQCGLVVCNEHYDKTGRQCHNCLHGSNSHAEQEYLALLQQAIADNRIDPEERKQLDDARKRLGLGETRAEELEAGCVSLSLGSHGQELERRERRRLEIAREELLAKFHIDEALSILTPLYERFKDNAEIRDLYLLALVETDPTRALDVIQTMRFDDLNKSLAHIEILIRQPDLDQATDILRRARRSFGDKHPSLLACEAELNIEEYRHTNRISMLDDARDCLGQLQADLNDPYVEVVKAYLEYVSGTQDALQKISQRLRDESLPAFFLLRLKNRIGLPQADVTEAAKESKITDATKCSLSENDNTPSDGIRVDSATVMEQYAQWLRQQTNYCGWKECVGGLGCDDPDAETKIASWRPIAESGVAEAQFLLAVALRTDVDGCAPWTQENEPEEVQWLKRAADQGFVEAQFYLGDVYASVAFGIRSSKDWWQQSFEWYRLAAENGHKKAQCRLGYMYWMGKVVPADDSVAATLFRKSAEQGFDGAQQSLGEAYETGRGVPQDYAQAITWYRMAIENGNDEALTRLGALYNKMGCEYRDGTRGTKDDSAAVRAFLDGAEAGNPVAQANLGYMYWMGRGVVKDLHEAVKWYRKAADQGDATAQTNMGIVCYNRLGGVQHDIFEAARWYKLAAEQGNESAKKNLALLEQKIKLIRQAGLTDPKEINQRFYEQQAMAALPVRLDFYKKKEAILEYPAPIELRFRQFLQERGIAFASEPSDGTLYCFDSTCVIRKTRLQKQRWDVVVQAINEWFDSEGVAGNMKRDPLYSDYLRWGGPS